MNFVDFDTHAWPRFRELFLDLLFSQDPSRKIKSESSVAREKQSVSEAALTRAALIHGLSRSFVQEIEKEFKKRDSRATSALADAEPRALSWERFRMGKGVDWVWSTPAVSNEIPPGLAPSDTPGQFQGPMQ